MDVPGVIIWQIKQRKLSAEDPGQGENRFFHGLENATVNDNGFKYNQFNITQNAFIRDKWKEYKQSHKLRKPIINREMLFTPRQRGTDLEDV